MPFADLVATRFDDEVRFLAELVKVPSDNPPGDCVAHAERAATLLAAEGFTVERHVVPPDLVAAHGMIAVTNLVVRHHFGPGPTIALSAHGDVVPPGRGWTHDPYGAAIVDGRLYGRGAAVSKSDFATYAFALDALRRSGRPLKGTVELHLTYDEETGGLVGPGWLLQSGLTRPDMAIVAGFTYAALVAHNGCLQLEVELLGRSAHAARPLTGVDALQAALPVMAAIYAMRSDLEGRSSAVPGIGAPQITIGLISGGTNTNVVPDRVLFRLDRRLVPEEAPEAVEAELVAAIEQAAHTADPRIEVRVRRVLLARPLVPTPASQHLAETIARHASAQLGLPVPIAGTPIFTDARLYGEAGIPTVLYGAGPRTVEEANGHRADEHVVLSDLRTATIVLAETLAELLA